MLTFDRDNGRFNHRVAGACIHEGHVLLTRADGESFWILPGGRVEIQEDTRSALRRELTEELCCDADIGPLLWVVEDFFVLSGRDYHEVAFVYGFYPRNPSVLERSRTRRIIDGGVRIELRWFAPEKLSSVNLQPAFLKRALPHPPASPTHLIVRE